MVSSNSNHPTDHRWGEHPGKMEGPAAACKALGSRPRAVAPPTMQDKRLHLDSPLTKRRSPLMRPARPANRPSNSSLSPGRGNGWLKGWPKRAGRRL